MPSLASQFRALADSGQDIVLPASGLTVSLRPVALSSLVRRGVIPSNLYSEAMSGFPELLRLQAQADSDVTALTKLSQTLLDVENLMFAWLSDALVSPRLSDTPNDDEIGLEHLPDEDKQFLMSVLMLPVKEWERFRTKQTGAIQPVADSESVQPAP